MREENQMSFIATNIMNVPVVDRAGNKYNWYIFLLPGKFKNNIREELLRNLIELAGEVGSKNLVVLGTNVDEFHSEVLLRYAMYLEGYDKKNVPLPALIVTDTAPSDVEVQSGEINAKIILFSIGEAYLRDGMLSNFLRLLCITLQDTDAFEALEKVKIDAIYKKWGWIPDYFEIKPNFFGFGVNLNKIIENLMKKKLQ
jgi:hypothetical protein